jgi:hypothetical protein
VLRVTTVTAGGVESPFASAPIAVYGVPSSLAPAPPQVVVERVDGRFVVTITAASAPVRATRFRLQRTRRGLADPLSMPVVAAGELTAQPDGRTAATVADPGAPESFMRWTWVAVVSAGVEPGSSRGATWSAPSPPLSITPVPDAAPEPVTSLAVEAGASQGMVVRFSAPLGLHGHRAVTTRITDDGAALVAETQLPENEDVTVVDDPGGAPGDRYAVTLIDPLGRAGTPATASAP